MLKKKDYESSQEVRWCPGCGDYAILASVQKVLAETGASKENTVFVSGIGCSSRFPYYIDTYGFHTIHGRAPTVATGLKMARPELNVWVITGDGDGLSIGTSHLVHLMRRNVNVTILLFNNRIYGLTKGQVSPTSEAGKRTKTTPQGSIDQPLDPIPLALAANCGFIARAIDVDSLRLQNILKQASQHPGTAFVEIYQNCNVFNDGAFTSFASKPCRAAHTLDLQLGQPMVFGDNQEKAIIRQQDGTLAVVEVAHVDAKDILIHNDNPDYLMALSALNLPVPIGVFRQQQRPTYESLHAEKKQTEVLSSQGCQAILEQGNTWDVTDANI